MTPEDPKPAEILGKIIDDARKGRWLSLRDLAQRIHVTHSYVRDMILGHRLPSAQVILRLCEELDLDCDEMMMIAGRVPESVYEHVHRSRKYVTFIRQLAEYRATDDEIDLLSSKFREIFNNRELELWTELLGEE